MAHGDSYGDDKAYLEQHHSVDSSIMHDEHKMSAGEYIKTRIPTLKPPFAKLPNPFKVLALLNTQQWLFFLVAFFGWTW